MNNEDKYENMNKQEKAIYNFYMIVILYLKILII